MPIYNNGYLVMLVIKIPTNIGEFGFLFINYSKNQNELDIGLHCLIFCSFARQL